MFCFYHFHTITLTLFQLLSKYFTTVPISWTLFCFCNIFTLMFLYYCSNFTVNLHLYIEFLVEYCFLLLFHKHYSYTNFLVMCQFNPFIIAIMFPYFNYIVLYQFSHITRCCYIQNVKMKNLNIHNNFLCQRLLGRNKKTLKSISPDGSDFGVNFQGNPNH